MITINENFLKLQDSYLFVTIAQKVKEYQAKHPEKEIIKLGIGDVTRPIPKKVAEAMKNAVDEISVGIPAGMCQNTQRIKENGWWNNGDREAVL